MAIAAVRKSERADLAPSRDQLAEELARLRSHNAAVYAREKELKSQLIAAAGTENFKVVVAGVGTVKVSAPKQKRCTGSAPELIIDAFNVLTEAQREKLTSKGVVKIVEQYSGPYYGAVTVDLF